MDRDLEKEITSAIADYSCIYRVPYALSANLELASAALAEMARLQSLLKYELEN